MKAKLIKLELHDGYRLDDENGLLIASTLESSKNKLSLKNCQAIERGYDLDELAKRHHKLAYIQAYNPDIAPYVEADYKAGFQKCLELMGDKKFSEEDMKYCWNQALKFEPVHITFGICIQSLQQNEWEVEIEIDVCGDKVYAVPEPKLDADGCLILKRVV